MNTNHKVLAKIGKIVGFVSSFMEIWQICQHTTTFCRYLSLLVHTGSQQEQNTNLGSPRTLLLAFDDGYLPPRPSMAYYLVLSDRVLRDVVLATKLVHECTTVLICLSPRGGRNRGEQRTTTFREGCCRWRKSLRATPAAKSEHRSSFPTSGCGSTGFFAPEYH